MIDITQQMNLINADYKEVMKDIPDKSVDCMITDPPYLISRKTNFATMGNRAGTVAMNFGGTEEGWDTKATQGSIEELLEPLFAECPRILKENSNVVVFNAWENLGTIAGLMREYHITPKRCLLLKKGNPAPFNMKVMFVNDIELAVWGVFNSKDKPTKWTFNNENKMRGCVFETSVQANDLHETQKDPKVIIDLTQLLSNKGDTVLDCFMGSGTQGIACKYLDRKFIGIEKDNIYFERAKNRIEYGIEKVKKELEEEKKEGQISLFDYLGIDKNGERK